VKALGEIGRKEGFDLLRELYSDERQNLGVRTACLDVLVEKDLGNSTESLWKVVEEHIAKPMFKSKILDYTAKRLEEIDSGELLQTVSTRYIDLYDNAPDMFFSIRPDGTVISLNQTGARQLGYKKEELVDHPVWKVIYEDDLQYVQSRIEDILKNKTVKEELEFRKITKTGKVLYVNERTKLVFDEKGKVSELRITCRDISDKKEAQGILQEQEEKTAAPVVIPHPDDCLLSWLVVEIQFENASIQLQGSKRLIGLPGLLHLK